MSELARALASAINYNSAENPSGTPDFVLGEFLADVQAAFDKALIRRGEWRHEPAEFNPVATLTSHNVTGNSHTVEEPKPKTHLDAMLEQVSREQADLLTGYMEYWQELPQFVEKFTPDFRFYVYDRAINAQLAPTEDEFDATFTVSIKVRRPTLKEAEDDRLRKAADTAFEESQRLAEARRKVLQDERDGAERLRNSGVDRVIVGFYSTEDVVKAEKALATMLDDYGYFSKVDFQSLANYTVDVRSMDLGWTSLEDIQIIDLGGTGNRHAISLPAPTDISELRTKDVGDSEARGREEVDKLWDASNEALKTVRVAESDLQENLEKATSSETPTTHEEDRIDNLEPQENNTAWDAVDADGTSVRERVQNTIGEARVAEAVELREKHLGQYRQVVQLKDRGLSNVAIGQQLGINESTVRGILMKHRELIDDDLRKDQQGNVESV